MDKNSSMFIKKTINRWKALHVFLCTCCDEHTDWEWAPTWRVSERCAPFCCLLSMGWFHGLKRGRGNIRECLQCCATPSVPMDTAPLGVHRLNLISCGRDGHKDTLHGQCPIQRSCQNNPTGTSAPVLLPSAEQLISDSSAPNLGTSARVLFVSHFPHLKAALLLSHSFTLAFCYTMPYEFVPRTGMVLRMIPLAFSGIHVLPACLGMNLPLLPILLSQQSKEVEFQGIPDLIIHWVLSSSERVRAQKEAGAALIFWVFQRCSTISHTSDIFDVFFCTIL